MQLKFILIRLINETLISQKIRIFIPVSDDGLADGSGLTIKMWVELAYYLLFVLYECNLRINFFTIIENSSAL